MLRDTRKPDWWRPRKNGATWQSREPIASAIVIEKITIWLVNVGYIPYYPHLSQLNLNFQIDPYVFICVLVCFAFHRTKKPQMPPIFGTPHSARLHTVTGVEAERHCVSATGDL